MAETKRFSFPKSKRLVSNRQFKAVLDCKLAVSDKFFCSISQRMIAAIGDWVFRWARAAAMRSFVIG